MLRRSTANGIRKWAYCYSILIVFLASRSLALITANENETVSRRSSTTVANESEKMMTASSSSKTNSQMITSAVVNENSNFTDTTNRLHLEENILKSVINNNQFIINDENNNQLYYSSGEDDDILNNAETSILSTLSPSMSNTASISSSDSNSGNGGGGGDDDDKKTLSQQVVDGKYGLIQKELFSVKTRRPGIISYDINPEVPKDNINNLGGLEPDDIWLAENHLLVLAGGSKVKDATSPWIPIDNYIAPSRQIILPERPKIPPPFPVQLTDNGPIEYLKGENGSTAPPPVIPFFLMFPPPPPPQTNNNQGRIPQYHLNRNPASPPINTLIPLRPSNYTPSYGPPPSSFIRPLYPTTTTGNLSLSPPLSPSLYKPPPGSEFIPPFGNISSDSFDEDDPSLYYPPPYDFYYPTDNTTNVPPGPLVPGIVLPPPPNFFSIQHGKTTSVDSRKPAKLGAHQRKLSKILPNKPVNVKTGSDKSVSLEFSTPIRYQDILNDVAYPDLGGNKIMYNNDNGKQNEQEQWVPIPAPKPYYITGGPKNTLIKNTVMIMGGTLPTTTTTSNKQEPATIPDEGYSYENPPTDNGGGYVLDDINKDNKKEFYTTAKPFYTVTSAKMYHPPIKTVPVEDKSVQKIYYFYEEPNKHITTNVNNKVQDITKNYFDTHYSNGYHHYRHNEYTTTPTSFLYHNDIVPTTPLPGSSTTPVSSSSKDSYNNNKKLNANKKTNNRYENNRQPKTAAVITGPPILPIYYLAELDNLNLPDYHPAVAPHHNYDYNKVSASPPVNYQYSNVANPQEASIYTNNNFLQQQPHPTPRPIFEYSYTATGYHRQNEGNHIINRPGENRNPYETEQISSNQQQPYQIKYHQTNDQYSLYQPKNKPLKNSNHQHPSNQPQTYWIDNTPTYTGGNLYNIRLASVSPPKQQQQQNGYFEYNNEPYEPNKSNPPYYVPLKHPPQSWNDNNNNNNNNNNNKWNQEENHSASGIGGKTAPAYYQTENPFYAFFTKDDEQFIDDNTKKYFTFFGQKIRKPEDTTVQVPASTIAISTNTASKKNPAHNNRQYASYHPTTTIEYNNEWGTTPLPPGKETGIDENESVTVSLEGDTLVNYIKPPITNEPEAELISGNLVTYSPSSSSSNKPYKEIVEDSSYFSSSTSAAINRNNRYREPLIEHSSEEYGQIGGTTTFKPISLEGDTDVNYKQNRPPINPDAEYISHRNHPDTKPRRTRIKTTSNNGGGRPYRQKPISLESDIAVNYRSHRPASNPNAEFIYRTPQRLNNWRGEQQRNRQQQHTAEGSQRMVSYRLPNSNEHLYFLTPKQIYKLEDLKNGGGNQRARKYEQLENENYDFQSDAEKSSNYLKRMMPSFFSSNNTATINTTTNTSSITNISDG